MIDISHRIIAKFSKAHSLAWLNRWEQLFDNDPDAACSIRRFQLVFSTLLSEPRCFEPLRQRNLHHGRPSNSTPTPMQSNASDEKTFAFSVFTVCCCLSRWIRPTSSTIVNVFCRVINARVSNVIRILGLMLTLIGCGGPRWQNGVHPVVTLNNRFTIVFNIHPLK